MLFEMDFQYSMAMKGCASLFSLLGRTGDRTLCICVLNPSAAIIQIHTAYQRRGNTHTQSAHLAVISD